MEVRKMAGVTVRVQPVMVERMALAIRMAAM
jgi:hypothetical protein